MLGLSEIQRQNAEAARKEQEKREGEARLQRIIGEHNYPHEKTDPAGR